MRFFFLFSNTIIFYPNNAGEYIYSNADLSLKQIQLEGSKEYRKVLMMSNRNVKLNNSDGKKKKSIIYKKYIDGRI
jgi:hypothetical protein